MSKRGKDLLGEGLIMREMIANDISDSWKKVSDELMKIAFLPVNLFSQTVENGTNLAVKTVNRASDKLKKTRDTFYDISLPFIVPSWYGRFSDSASRLSYLGYMGKKIKYGVSDLINPLLAFGNYSVAGEKNKSYELEALLEHLTGNLKVATNFSDRLDQIKDIINKLCDNDGLPHPRYGMQGCDSKCDEVCPYFSKEDPVWVMILNDNSTVNAARIREIYKSLHPELIKQVQAGASVAEYTPQDRPSNFSFRNYSINKFEYGEII
jgi:hypothetical protein